MRVLYLANQAMNSHSDRMTIEQMKKILANPFQSSDKLNTPLITHSSCESKSKEFILEHNKQELLSVDIDDGFYQDIGVVSKEIGELGIQCYCVYTTASHSPKEDKFKFRVVIPLDTALTCEQFTVTQLALAKIFNSDDVVARVQQILYLPKSDIYYTYIDNLDGPRFNIEQSPELQKVIIEVNEERERIQKEKEEEQRLIILQREQRKSQIAERGGEKLESVFDLVESQYTMVELLSQYGFKKKGGRYLHPNSSSGLAGVMILDGHYYSHHSQDTDELADGRSHSCFDLIKYWEYGNSQEEAIEGLSKEMMIGGKTLLEYNNEIKKGNVESEIEKHNLQMHKNLQAIEQRQQEKAEIAALYPKEDDHFDPILVDSNDNHGYEPDLIADQAVVEENQTQAITTLNEKAIEIDVDSDEIINFDAHSNIMPTKKIDFDMLKPTGLVQRLIEEICIRMHRPDPALAVAPALYIAMRASLPSVENSRLNDDYDIKNYGVGLNGFKIYLNLLTIGISASGKDKPQQLLDSTLNYLGDDVYGRVASDKDLAISLIDSIGSTCLVIDEAGGLFSSMKDSGSASYMKNLPGTMMSYATAKHVNFDGLIKRGLKKDYLVNLHTLNKSLDNVDADSPEAEAHIKSNIKKEIELMKWRVNACQNGVAMPQMAILATSTPTDMKGTISIQALDTGQLSRYLMFVGKSDVDMLREKVEGIDYDSLSEEVLAKLWWIKSKSHVAEKYELRKNAVNTYQYISKWFESRRNHTRFSVLYRRGFETVVRLASILAFEDRLVTIEHLEWSFCLVRANIESFAITCAYEDEKSTDGDKLQISILNTLKSSDKGIYISTLKQRFGKKSEFTTVMPFFDTCLQQLIDGGYAKLEGKTVSFSGKNSIDEV